MAFKFNEKVYRGIGSLSRHLFTSWVLGTHAADSHRKMQLEITQFPQILTFMPHISSPSRTPNSQPHSAIRFRRERFAHNSNSQIHQKRDFICKCNFSCAHQLVDRATHEQTRMNETVCFTQQRRAECMRWVLSRIRRNAWYLAKCHSQ